MVVHKISTTQNGSAAAAVGAGGIIQGCVQMRTARPLPLIACLAAAARVFVSPRINDRKNGFGLEFKASILNIKPISKIFKEALINP